MLVSYKNKTETAVKRIEEEDSLKKRLKEMDENIKNCENFKIDPLENVKLLGEKRGASIVNKFEELPDELKKIDSESDLVKWYQYRVRQMLRITSSVSVNGIVEYAIKVSARESSELLVEIYKYYLLKDYWSRADDFEPKIDKDILKICRKEIQKEKEVEKGQDAPFCKQQKI